MTRSAKPPKKCEKLSAAEESSISSFYFSTQLMENTLQNFDRLFKINVNFSFFLENEPSISTSITILVLKSLVFD